MPTRLRNMAPITAPKDEDPLAAFTSETQRQGGQTFVVQNFAMDLSNPARVPDNPPKRKRVRHVASLRASMRQLMVRTAATASALPRIGHGVNLRLLATTSTLISFAGGAASGVFVMWLAGAERSPHVMLSTEQSVAPAIPRQQETYLLVKPPASQPAVETNGRSSTSRSPVIAAVTEGSVGTSGRRLRAASTFSTNRKEAPGVARPARYRGSLVFRSAPLGARVFVNGTFVGSTPLVLENLPVGSRAVRFEADGYQRWSALTRVVANQQTHVSATLDQAVP